MRAAAVGATSSGRGAPVLAGAAAVIVGCALFLADGSAEGPLVWLGGAALVVAAGGAAAAALGLLPAPPLDGPAVAFVGCLAGLVVWLGVSVAWSIEPSTSWSFTNRTLAYLGFAVLGLLVGTLLRRGAAAALAWTLTLLLGLVFAWALAAKVVPGLYPDYGRVARLRSPIEYWNELALLGDVAIGLALWVAAPRARAPALRAGGATLLYAVVVAVLLTYSRFGIALAVVVAVGWLLLERDRVESLVVVALAGLPAIGLFLYALSLPGISDDGQSRAQRAHDGWRFGLVLLAGAVVVFVACFALARFEARRPLSPRLRTRIERGALWVGVAAAAGGLALAVVFSGRIWHGFTGTQQVTNANARLTQLGSSNRWTWWQEAWHAFLGHPAAGTGAGTFDLTNRLHRTSSFDVATEPHSTPLQFLSETGIVGFLLWAGALAAAGTGVVRARRRDGGAAVTALGLGLAAWVLHMLVDIDWSFVAVCGPLLLAAGALVAGQARREPVARRRRPLLAIGGVAFALVGVYSLAAPWLAQRQIGSSNAAVARARYAEAAASARTARSYDPLSVLALWQVAALELDPGRARADYERAISLEPLNPDTWYELGAFEFGRRNWYVAYKALDRSWGLDRHGPAGVHCGLLDQVRRRVKHYGPRCPRTATAATP